MVWIAAGAAWIVCGVLAYGLAFGELQGMLNDLPDMQKECTTDDRWVALFMAVWGPVGLFAVTVNGGLEYPLKFRTSERIERCESKH